MILSALQRLVALMNLGQSPNPSEPVSGAGFLR
jgi:hypothetical protein